jgi:hypothetical protein
VVLQVIFAFMYDRSIEGTRREWQKVDTSSGVNSALYFLDSSIRGNRVADEKRFRLRLEMFCDVRGITCNNILIHAVGTSTCTVPVH